MLVRVNDRRPFAALLGALIALAWLALWAWDRSPYARFLSHDGLAHSDVASDGALAVIFIAGWTLMIVAMMLPTSLPLIALFHSLTRRRPRQASLVGLLIAGYLAIWIPFGLLAHAADTALHAMIEHNGWLNARSWLLGAGVLFVAGVYQFTPLKYQCLDQCRTPLGFIMAHWHGQHDRKQAWLLGVRHGLYCLGCCWSLMLLMFAVGLGNIGWMLLLGATMAAEKNLPWGRRLSPALGLALLALAALITLQSVMTF